MAKLTVLLGVGFSRPAGFPLVGDINDRFSRDLTDKLLNHSAGEWQWVDKKNDAALHNGRLSYDLIGYSFVIDELSSSFVAEHGEFTSTNNYEVFFPFCLNATQDKEKIASVFERAKVACLEEFPDLPKHYLFVFENPRYSLPVDIINYLFWDILLVPLVEELLEEYKEFLDLVDAYQEVEFFSLNHDLLLEYLLNHRGISFTRGFSSTGSNIAYDDKPLPTFNADFSQGKVKLF